MMYQCVHCGGTFSTRDRDERRCFQCRAENCNPAETARAEADEQAAEAAFESWAVAEMGDEWRGLIAENGVESGIVGRAFLAGWKAAKGSK